MLLNIPFQENWSLKFCLPEDTSTWEEASYLLFFNDVVSLCIYACECSAQGCQKRALDPLELELQDVELWMLGAKFGSSEE